MVGIVERRPAITPGPAAGRYPPLSADVPIITPVSVSQPHPALSILALIPARGGSRRVPGKNLAVVGGRPLIAWTIEAARHARSITRVVVDTDSPAIAEVARQWGAEVPYLRPPELATDEATSLDVVRQALDRLAAEGFEPQWVCLLQPTSPLRRAHDIEAAVALALNGGADAVVSVTPRPMPAAWHRRLGDRGQLQQPAAGDDATHVLNGAIYLARSDVLRTQGTWYTPRTLGYVMPVERSLDIDTPWDMRLARGVMRAEESCPVLRVGDRMIGPGQPCYVIAEAGVNHNGDLATAKSLIDAAAAAGADAVKFQTFRADAVAAAATPKAAYQKHATDAEESQQAMLRRLELSPDAHVALIARCRERGIMFLSTPFDEASVDLLVSLGVMAIKVPSGEVTNRLLLEHVAATGLPVILSTGMSDLYEVAAAVEVLRHGRCPELAVLHCVSAYPAAAGDANLRAIATLRDALQLPVGWSDHTTGTDVAVAAVAMGACIIEKHLTLDRSMPGPDHAASLEPAEFTQVVGGIRTVESAMGHGVKRPTPDELAMRDVARRSLVAATDIPAGTLVDRSMVTALRPGTGISPMALASVLGRRWPHALKRGQAFRTASSE